MCGAERRIMYQGRARRAEETDVEGMGKRRTEINIRKRYRK
jgi:hypothetical protein